MSRKAKNLERPVGVDLFAGAGGMTLGFESAGFDVLCSVEIDPIHCATHEYNFPMWSVICESVEHVSGTMIRQRSDIGNRDIDVVFGGPPCQGFSMIGKRALEDPRNSLMRDFVRIALELQPKHVVMENVSGLTVGAHRAFLEEVIQVLESAGYDTVKPYRVLDASQYGVPQRRRRLFLIASRNGETPARYPECTSTTGTSSNGDRPRLNATPTVWDAIGDLPRVDDYPELLVSDTAPVAFNQPSAYAEILRGAEIDSEDFSYPRPMDPERVTSSARTRHTPLSQQRFSSTACGETEPISRFRKLELEGYCNTLRAGTHSNKGAYTSPRPIHPTEPRCITVREAARLHSYPDWFRFHVTKWHGFRQVGNSVPPLLARAVGREIMRALGLHAVRPSVVLPLGDVALLDLNPGDAARRLGVDPCIMGTRTRATGKVVA